MMEQLRHTKKWLLLVLVVVLLTALPGVVTGCEDFQIAPPAEEEAPKEVTPPPTVILTKDQAILAVYEHLLTQAESHEAKEYLADFYAACDNWTAQSEYFKDGSGVWYVIVDMTLVEPWELRAYWQQAGWFVFREGKVLPASHLEANALRIEADLQEMSLKPEPDEE